MKPKRIVINDYGASPSKINLGTAGSFGNEVLDLQFSTSWDGLAKYAVFNMPSIDSISVLIDETDMLEVPHNVTEIETDNGTINIVGYRDGQQIITRDIRFSVEKHSDIYGNEPTEQDKTLIQQILDAANNAQEKADEAIEVTNALKNIIPIPGEQDNGKVVTAENGSLVLKTPTGGGVAENGATFTPSVSEDGVISWTNDKGLENPEPVNIKGMSAYDSAVAGGYTGTTDDFYQSLSKITDVFSGEVIISGGNAPKI